MSSWMPWRRFYKYSSVPIGDGRHEFSNSWTENWRLLKGEFCGLTFLVTLLASWQNLLKVFISVRRCLLKGTARLNADPRFVKVCPVSGLHSYRENTQNKYTYLHVRCTKIQSSIAVTLTALTQYINPLKPKRRPVYLKPQSVPRSKHFSSRL
jgi:hypothetical protein